MSSKPIRIPKAKVASFCKRHHIRRLALFGSALRPDFGPKSDIDVLVEFEPGHVPGLAFFGMQDELSKILGRHVDLNTPNFISRHIREQVLKEARELYAACTAGSLQSDHIAGQRQGAGIGASSGHTARSCPAAGRRQW